MIKKNQYSVFAGFSSELRSGKVIVFKKKEKWNDFTFYTRYSSSIYKDGIECHSMEVFVAAYDSNHKATGLGNVMEGTNSIELSYKKNNIQFFSMLKDINEYRSLLRAFPIDEANEILEAMHELVYLKMHLAEIPNMENSLYSKAIQTDVFKKSFLRHSSSFFSFKASGNILKGLIYEELDSISNVLHMKFKMSSLQKPHTLDLIYDPTSLIPKRVNVLIGKNGLGKSQTLSHFVLLANDKINDSVSSRNNFTLHDPTSINKRPMINRIIAFVMPGDGGDAYPNEEDIENISYKKIALNRNHDKIKLNIGEEIISLARNINHIANISRWDIFINALGKTIPLKHLFIDTKDNSQVNLRDLAGKTINEERKLILWNSIPDSAEPYFKIDKKKHDLSSGQLAFFKFALEACQHIENGTYVLIDEPETHMHPNYISEFMSLLDDILEKTGSLALIATHSPYIVREVSRKQVNVFRTNEEEQFEIVKPRLKTFGANINDISDFIFEDDITNKLSDKLLLKARSEKKNFNDIKKICGDELPVEMLHYLKQALEGDKDEETTTA
ncbi:hypothetical protein VH86_03025 [Pantoea sp. BL1]|uniref:AAA family ATPase n=1 Tax=Pantoea sp. BL1 TaxID=1628190 RepID=UPI0005F78536|nr:AAA family ATPase [Pantoea sp. BL1]KJV50151.1 hypothetical protein VH86_03025 [Pantoea sp. BL1]